MRIKEATEQGISRLRDPQWANHHAYVRIDLVEVNGVTGHGPWAHLYDRKTQEAIGEPTPQTFLITSLIDDSGEPYTGELDMIDGTRGSSGG